jgi:hypothetical protein
MSRNLKPNFDYEEGKHHKTRAVGQLWMGPLNAKGYDNRVMELTVHETEFRNSVDAERFMERQRRRLAGKNGLMKQRRMKLQSIASD